MLIIKILFVISAVISVALTEYPFEGRYLTQSNGVLNSGNVNYRLPNQSHPETYDISLVTRVDQGDFDYQGVVKIGIVVDEPTRQIVLHKSLLTVIEVKLTRVSGPPPQQVPLLPYTYDTVTELLTIPTNGTTLNAGDRLNLEISFSNALGTNRRGFFRMSYDDSAGNKM